VSGSSSWIGVEAEGHSRDETLHARRRTLTGDATSVEVGAVEVAADADLDGLPQRRLELIEIDAASHVVGLTVPGNRLG
jgi:hypothetical protein